MLSITHSKLYKSDKAIIYLVIFLIISGIIDCLPFHVTIIHCKYFMRKFFDGKYCGRCENIVKTFYDQQYFDESLEFKHVIVVDKKVDEDNDKFCGDLFIKYEKQSDVSKGQKFWRKMFKKYTVVSPMDMIVDKKMNDQIMVE